ncbi:MAG TPA: hypothetical protein VF160_05945 [Candidatus Dormibacteraeota bacterium]
MAKKGKRRQQGKRPRPTFAPPPAAAGTGAATASAAPRPAAPARVGGNEALVRSVEMSLAPRAAGAGRKGQRGPLVLEGVDPAIPLDRVPYFVPDLRKLGVVAVIMVVLLVVAARLMPLLLH